MCKDVVGKLKKKFKVKYDLSMLVLKLEQFKCLHATCLD